MDLHQKECPNCGDFIPLTRRVLVFRPLPRRLTCPTCGFQVKTTYFYRSMTFFFWTMRNYMLLGTAFLIVVGYAKTVNVDKYGFSLFFGFLFKFGPIIIVVCALICLLTSFTIQALIDFFIQPDSE